MKKLFPSGLFPAILAFVVLDFIVLAMGYVSSRQLDADATAINLVGRQRMLTQRVTKAALLATDNALPEPQRRAAAFEAVQAYALFRQTLTALTQGGSTEGGDSRIVTLDSLGGHAYAQLSDVTRLLEPWPQAPLAEPALGAFTSFMVTHNERLLDAMNRLTYEIENRSGDVARRLRGVQMFVFGLSLLNFFAILRLAENARARAEAASLTDPLTGSLNRAGFFNALDRALAATRSGGKPCGVMLIDLDDFKSINDQFGHAAGDEALREVARRIDAWCASSWSFGRIGGDEFAIVCPGVSAQELDGAAQELRARLLTGASGSPLIGASVGTAIGDHATTSDLLLAAADANMYADKAEKSAASRLRRSPRQD